jgi:hypothetical protein
MEPELSLSCSQEPATGPYPELCECIPHTLVIFPCNPFNITLTSTPKVSHWSLSFKFSYQNLTCSSFLSSSCYMLYPPRLKYERFCYCCYLTINILELFSLIPYILLIISKCIEYRILQRTENVYQWMLMQYRIGALKTN